MPAIVDHDERRELIANVTKEIIAEAGMKGVTIRNVARRAGFSSTIISHYFHDKQHMLVYAYETVLKNADARVQKVIEQGGDMMSCLEVLLPINKANLMDWQAWFGFWGTVTADPDLLELRQAGLEKTQSRFRLILERAKEAGELPADLDVAFHASKLQMLFNGLASLVLMNPSDWPVKAQKEVLSWHLDLIKLKPMTSNPSETARPRRAKGPAKPRARAAASPK